jgi:hypothetical protein
MHHENNHKGHERSSKEESLNKFALPKPHRCLAAFHERQFHDVEHKDEFHDGD